MLEKALGLAIALTALRTSVWAARLQIHPLDSRLDDGSGIDGPGDTAAEVSGGPSMQHPILTKLDGGGEHVDGDSIMNELGGLLATRLPLLSADDPYAPALRSLAASLGRPTPFQVGPRVVS